MNKFFKISSLLLLAVPGMLSADSCSSSCSGSNGSGSNQATDFSGHTFFSIRPQFQSQDPEKIAFFREDAMYGACDGWGGAFQVAFFGGKSRRCKDLTKWFFPFGKTELLVNAADENQATPFVERDVDAQNFNIQTVNADTFQSKITMCPEQTVFGIGFDWKHMFSTKEDGTMGFWGEVSLPVTRVNNRLNFKETIINDGGGAVAGSPSNMTEAFQQEALKFARIDNKCHEKWGVADVEIKVGYNFKETDCFHIDGWVGVIAPTGNKPNGVNVFEPIIGHNKHAGLMIGGSYGYDCWQTDCGVWRVEADLVSKYFVSKCETRTVDLIDKQWSRYMQMYASQEDAIAGNNVFGANLFTVNMNVSPRFTFNYSTAVIYDHDCGASFEFGYNFWVRQAEDICIKNFAHTPVIVDAQQPGNYNPARTIAHQYELAFPLSVQNNYRPLTVADINFNSAAHPAALSHTFYAAGNYEWDICARPMFTNFGGSYEYSSNNAALQRWTLFGKLGFAF